MQIVYSIHVCSGGSREANGGNCPPLASHTLGGALLRRAMKNTVQYIVSLQYFCFLLRDVQSPPLPQRSHLRPLTKVLDPLLLTCNITAYECVVGLRQL